MHKLFSFNNNNSNQQHNTDSELSNQWGEIQCKFFIKAMRRGAVGKEFILNQQKLHYEDLSKKFLKHVNEDEKNKDQEEDKKIKEEWKLQVERAKLKLDIIKKKIATIEGEVKTIEGEVKTDKDSDSNKIELFSDMLEYIPDEAQEKIVAMIRSGDMFEYIPDEAQEKIVPIVRSGPDNEHFKSDITCIEDTICDIYTINYDYDYNKLWLHYKNAQNSIFEEQDYLSLTTKFAIVDGLKSLLTNKYISHSWDSNPDISDLANDIVTVNANLALLGALLVTLAFPLYTAGSVTDAWYDSDYGIIIYLYGVIGCGVFESTCLLIAIRNIVAINLIQTKNMKSFVKSSTKSLLLPISLNMLGVLSLLIALLAYGYSVLGQNFFTFFLIILVIPAVVLLFYVNSAVVKDIYRTQPWYHGNLENWSKLDPKTKIEKREEIEKKKREIREKEISKEKKKQSTLRQATIKHEQKPESEKKIIPVSH